MMEIISDLKSFTSQMDANRSYFESIDEIMGATFKLTVALSKAEEEIFSVLSTLNDMKHMLEDDPKLFLENLKSFNEASDNLFFDDTDLKDPVDCDKLLEKIINQLSSEEKGIIFQIDEEKGNVSLTLENSKQRSKILMYINERNRRSEQRQLLYQTSLITLSNSFEALISRLIRFIITESDVSKLSDKKLSYQEIVELGGLNEAKEHLIEKVVEDEMRGSQINWLSFIAKNTSKDFFNELVDDEEKMFIEFFLRRNLIIHNNSRINKRYIYKASVKNINADQIIGKKLPVTKLYLSKNFKVIFVIGVKACYYVLNNKSPNTDYRELFENFHEIAFEKLNQEDYDIANKIFSMLWKNKNKLNAEDQLLLAVNYMQSLKWNNKEKELQNLLKNYDFSLAKDVHNMCISILKGDYANSVFFLDKQLKQEIAENKDELDLLNDFLSWPIFKEFKDSDELDIYLKEKGYRGIEADILEDKEFEDRGNLCNNVRRRPITYISELPKVTSKKKYRYKTESNKKYR